MIYENDDDLGYWSGDEPLPPGRFFYGLGEPPEFFPPGSSLRECNAIISGEQQDAIVMAAWHADDNPALAECWRIKAGYAKLT